MTAVGVLSELERHHPRGRTAGQSGGVRGGGTRGRGRPDWVHAHLFKSGDRGGVPGHARREGGRDQLFTGVSPESSDRTRKFAIGALGNIAACTVNKLKLVEHKNKEVVKYVLFITRLKLIKALWKVRQRKTTGG